ncbi:lipid A deacylase LpxR family protein, partial [Acidobacteriota bacterium]
SNGLKLTWISKDFEKSRDNVLFGWMPSIRKSGFKHMFSYSLRQDVFTPDDAKRVDLDINDRPFAGYLNFEVGSHSLNEYRMSSFSLSLGVVGPMSLAEQAQKFIHDDEHEPSDQGWARQLKNEPAVQIMYESRNKLTFFGRNKGLGFDLITHIGGGLGNVYTYANAGFQVRLGWNLPRDFGQPLLRPGGSSGVIVFERDSGRGRQAHDGVYIFVALDGQFVPRNIFLDGNTFTDSHNVKKELLTNNIQIGCGIKVENLYLNVAYAKWSRTFKTQKNYQAYLIMSLAFSY